LAKKNFQTVTQNAIKKSEKHVLGLMITLYWIAKNNLPLNLFQKTVSLSRSLNSPYYSEGNRINYENPISAHELLTAISLSIEETIWDELSQPSSIGGFS
jgi:hypothetical protein